jgi:hypothetical protein
MRVNLSKEGRGAPKTGRQREKTPGGKEIEKKQTPPLQDENGGREGDEKNRGDGVGPSAERGVLVVERAAVMMGGGLIAEGTNGGHQDEGEISRQEEPGDQRTERAWEHGDIIIFVRNHVKSF